MMSNRIDTDTAVQSAEAISRQSQDVDVAIVGFGPVGQVLTALLGRAGHAVATFERHHDCYPLPRAVRFDGEAMRLFRRLGIADDIAAEVTPVGAYEWFGADGRSIVEMDASGPQPSGFAHSYLFYQPLVERTLDRAARSSKPAIVERGWMVESIVQHDDRVELTMRRTGPDGMVTDDAPARRVTARYVIAADGANSVVRECAHIQRTDYGFAEYWLVIDVKPHDMTRFDRVPKAAQHCDPRRPYSAIANGRSYRRWEFMLLPGEQPEDFLDEPDRVWRLLEPHIGRGEGEIIRQAVYQFRSLVADTLRDGRVLLAGDAAHLMPPFMGEGMNSGLRDAVNLAWKLDLLLRGVAPDAILDSYGAERVPQNEAAVAMSMQMGQVSCMLDPDQAAERDAALRAQPPGPPPPLPGLSAGIRHAHPDDKVSGTYAVHGRFAAERGTGFADEVLGTGFCVLSTRHDPTAVLDAERTDFLRQLGCSFGTLDPTQPGHLRDTDGRFSDWMAANGIEAVIIRPDGYAFGGVSVRELAGLVDQLQAAITGRPRQRAPGDLTAALSDQASS